MFLKISGSTRFYQEDATMLPRHEDLNVKEGRMPLLFVIVGILVTLMIMGALLTAILAVRRQRAAKLNQIEIQSGSSSGEEMGELFHSDGGKISCFPNIVHTKIHVFFLSDL